MLTDKQNQVTVDDQTVAVNDLSKPVNEDNKAVPVAPAAETQEAPAEAPVVEVPAAETLEAQPAVPVPKLRCSSCQC